MRTLRALAAALALVALPAAANEITVYSGGAAKAGLDPAAAAFAKARGAKVAIEYHPMGPLVKKLADGAKPDVVILTEETVPQIAEGLIARDPLTEVARVGIGVAVHETAPSPDISTPEALKRALLAATSVVYIDPTRGTSGRHFAGVLQQLGILDAVNAKTTFGSGGYVVEPVGRGEIELGVHQISEIIPVKGVKLVGPLPAALQKETVYVGAVTTAAKNPADARAFLAFLRTPESRALFAARGFNER